MPRPLCVGQGNLTGATRYRETFFRRRLVLQVEEELRRQRVHGDGYQGADGLLIRQWRDAEPGDLILIQYLREKASGKIQPPPPPDR